MYMYIYGYMRMHVYMEKNKYCGCNKSPPLFGR